MAETIKILGQASPLATTEADLYVVPGGTSTVVSSLVVCNRGASETTWRVAIVAGGGGTQDFSYIYYDVLLAAADTFVATVGLTLGATDVVRIYAGNTNLSFSLFGVERT